jgi:predicted ATP-binding protein involved in virulence
MHDQLGSITTVSYLILLSIDFRFLLFKMISLYYFVDKIDLYLSGDVLQRIHDILFIFGNVDLCSTEHTLKLSAGTKNRIIVLDKLIFK